jgi:hypothetical protein
MKDRLLLIPIFFAIFGLVVSGFFLAPVHAFKCEGNICSDNPVYDYTNPNQPDHAKGCPNDDHTSSHQLMLLCDLSDQCQAM